MASKQPVTKIQKNKSKRAEEAEEVEGKNIKKKINIDDLHKKSAENALNRIQNINKAVELFKTDIIQDFEEKVEKSVEKNYNKTYLYMWKSGKEPEESNEFEAQYYKKYNGMKPFDIINAYKNSAGKSKFIKEVSDEINDKYSSQTTKFFIKYEKIYDNKWVIWARFYTPKTQIISDIIDEEEDIE